MSSEACEKLLFAPLVAAARAVFDQRGQPFGFNAISTTTNKQVQPQRAKISYGPLAVGAVGLMLTAASFVALIIAGLAAADTCPIRFRALPASLRATPRMVRKAR